MSADWHDVLASLPPEAHRAWQPAETLSAGCGAWGEVAGTSARDRGWVVLRLRAGVPGEPPGVLAAAASRARRVREVECPHLAAVHDVIETPAGLALVLERVRGRPFDLWLAEAAPDLAAALDALGRAAAAVASLHGAGIVHAALCPEAVRVEDDGGVRVHGAAPLPDEPMGARGRRFVAPELAAGFPPLPSADVYSLGRLLEEALAAVPSPPGAAGPLRALATRALGDRRERLPDARAFLEGLIAAWPEESPSAPRAAAPTPPREALPELELDPDPPALPAPPPAPPPTPPPAPPPSPPPPRSPREAGPTPAPREVRWRLLGEPSREGPVEVLLDALPGRAPVLDELAATLRRAALGRRTLCCLLAGEISPGGRRVRIWTALSPEELPAGAAPADLLAARISDARRAGVGSRPDGVPLHVVGYAVLGGDPHAPPTRPGRLDLAVALLMDGGGGAGSRRFALYTRDAGDEGRSLPLPGARAATLADRATEEAWLPLLPPAPPVRRLAPARPSPATVVRRGPAPPSHRRRALVLGALVLLAVVGLAAALGLGARARPITPEGFAATARLEEGTPFWRRPPGIAPGGGDVLYTLAFAEGHDPRRHPPSGYALHLSRPGAPPLEVPAEEVEPGLWGFTADGRDPLWSAGEGRIAAALRHLGGEPVWAADLPFGGAEPPAPVPPPPPASPRVGTPPRLSLAGSAAGGGAPLLLSHRDGGRAFGERVTLGADRGGTVSLEVRAAGRACDGGALEVGRGSTDATAAVVEAAGRCSTLLAAHGGRAEIRARAGSGAAAKAEIVWADDWFQPLPRGEVPRRGADLLGRIRLRGAFTAGELRARVSGREVQGAALALPRPGWIDQDVTTEVEKLLRDAEALGVDLEGPPVVRLELLAGAARLGIDLVRADLADGPRLLREGAWRLLCVSARDAAGVPAEGIAVFVDGWGRVEAAPDCASPERFRRVWPEEVRVGLAPAGGLLVQARARVGTRRAVALECRTGGAETGGIGCLPREVAVEGEAWAERVLSILRSGT
ncbi:hypothetical protein L6R50_06830 [Myxococcota bacterium]|nr:hypothetical protein [Myxococcota bacterium]